MELNNKFFLEGNELQNDIIDHSFFDLRIRSLPFNKVTKKNFSNIDILHVYHNFNPNNFVYNSKPVWIKWIMNLDNHLNSKEAYLESLSKKNRYSIGKTVKRINNSSQLTFEIVNSNEDNYSLFKKLYLNMISNMSYGMDFLTEEKALFLKENIEIFFLKEKGKIVAGAVLEVEDNCYRICFLASNSQINQKYGVDVTKFFYFKAIERSFEKKISMVSLGYDYSTYGFGISCGLSDLKYRMGFRPLPPNAVDSKERIEIVTEKVISMKPNVYYSYKYNNNYNKLKLDVYISNVLNNCEFAKLSANLMKIYSDIDLEIKKVPKNNKKKGF